MLLKEITPEDVSDFIVDFKPKKESVSSVKSSTIHKHLQVLRKMLNLADEFGYEVERNPVRPFHFSNEAETRRTRVLSSEEEERLMAEAAPHLRPIIQMALQTGMRLQEILRLRIDDVDFSQDTVMIRPEVNKTGKLDCIPLPHSLKLMLRNLIQENSGRTENVFNYSDPRTGRYRPISSIQHGFQAACKRAKVMGLQFRDLRRTFGTRLHQKGVDSLIIQRLLRHSSFKISEQVYIQSNMRMMREAVNGRAGKPTASAKMEHIWNTEGSGEKRTPVNPWLSMN
jgi:integrase